jgi:hypothetical protein
MVIRILFHWPVLKVKTPRPKDTPAAKLHSVQGEALVVQGG